MNFRAPRGTNDLIAQPAWDHQRLCQQASELFGRYAYAPIETPSFEALEVFVRGIGQATDVVGKEMYFVATQAALDKVRAGGELEPDERLALRPEMTAGVARAVLQRGVVVPDGPLVKLQYAGSMFRHERPQKGRLREFHQIGVECLGSAEPSADAEVIIMLMHYFESLGLSAGQLRLLINSMGDEHCRPAYREQVRDFILAHTEGSEALCDDCVRRAQTNPLRAFDCKNPGCRSVMAAAPVITDALCEACADHYAQVKELLTAAGIAFVEDPHLVRGLDYYTRTVFEVQTDDGLGSQNAIGGGGRYDRLLEEFGGKPTPGLGFAIGIERLQMTLQSRSLSAPYPTVQVYVAAASSEARPAALTLANQLRRAGLSAELDHQGRSLKSQLKSADRMGAGYLIALGPDELAAGTVNLRDLRSDLSYELTLEGAADQAAKLLQGHGMPAAARSL